MKKLKQFVISSIRYLFIHTNVNKQYHRGLSHSKAMNIVSLLSRCADNNKNVILIFQTTLK